jgi:hypothetical protein
VYSILVAGLVSVSAVAMLNLVLSFAIIRRLRVADGARAGGAQPDDDDMPLPGTVVGAFTVATVDGDELTEQALATGATFVALVQPGCPACGTFADALDRRDVHLPEGSIVLVAPGHGADTEPFARRLSAHARVGLLVKENDLLAFGAVNALPAYLRIEHGVVAAADHRASRLLAGMTSATPGRAAGRGRVA